MEKITKTLNLSSTDVNIEKMNIKKYMFYDNAYFLYVKLGSTCGQSMFYKTFDDAYKDALLICKNYNNGYGEFYFSITDSNNNVVKYKITQRGNIILLSNSHNTIITNIKTLTKEKKPSNITQKNSCIASESFTNYDMTNKTNNNFDIKLTENMEENITEIKTVNDKLNFNNFVETLSSVITLYVNPTPDFLNYLKYKKLSLTADVKELSYNLFFVNIINENKLEIGINYGKTITVNINDNTTYNLKQQISSTICQLIIGAYMSEKTRKDISMYIEPNSILEFFYSSPLLSIEFSCID